MITRSNGEKEAPKGKDDKVKKCGIIMPIAETAGYAPGHWKDVLKILNETIDKTEFTPQLVSDDDAIGLIHDRIVTNIYNNDIVICDVSSKNPNVMFELGMRLAFDKPTIIIKDEKTDYSFDTGVIEHLPYPSSLRFHNIIEFQSLLIERLNATYKRSQSESDYSPFLKSFGRTLKPATMNPSEITETKYIIDELSKIRREIATLKKITDIEYITHDILPSKEPIYHNNGDEKYEMLKDEGSNSYIFRIKKK